MALDYLLSHDIPKTDIRRRSNRSRKTLILLLPALAGSPSSRLGIEDTLGSPMR